MELECSICGSSNLEFEFEYDKNYSYYRCNNCGVLKRMPDNIIIDYENDYMDNDKILKSKWLAKNYYRRLHNSINENSMCLEIGGSFGFFCKLLNERKNCTTRNIELSKSASEFANKNGVVTFANIEDLDIKKFDYIFAFHVVEHIEPDKLKDFVNDIMNLLNEKGKLFIFTPNAGSSKIKFQKKRFNWLAPDEHISFLSEDSINYLIDDKTMYETSVNTAIPSLIHYPTNSFLGLLRKKLLKNNVSTIIGNSEGKPKINLKSYIILKLKTAFSWSIIVEKFVLVPFCWIFDMFTKSHDELVVKITKK